MLEDEGADSKGLMGRRGRMLEVLPRHCRRDWERPSPCPEKNDFFT